MKRQRMLDAVTQAPEQRSVRDEDGLDEVELPSDVEAAIIFLTQQFKAHACAPRPHQTQQQQQQQRRWQDLSQLPPLVLVSQLPSIIKNRREIDAQVDALRRANKVRMFKLATGVDEHGLLLTPEYLRVVREAARRAAEARQTQAAALGLDDAGADDDGEVAAAPRALHPTPQQQQQPDEQMVAEAFCSSVVPACTDVSLPVHHMLGLIRAAAISAGGTHTQQGRGGSGRSSGGMDLVTASADALLSALLHLGVVARHPQDDSTLMFACAGLGPIVKSVLAGRSELLSLLSRKPNKEMPERTLLGNALARLQIANDRTTGGHAATAPLEGGFLRPLVGIAQQGTGGAAAGAAGPEQQGTSAAGPIKASMGVRLKQSCLSVSFHLRDLLGRGDVTKVATPAGPIIRVNPATSGERRGA